MALLAVVTLIPILVAACVLFAVRHSVAVGLPGFSSIDVVEQDTRRACDVRGHWLPFQSGTSAYRVTSGEDSTWLTRTPLDPGGVFMPNGPNRVLLGIPIWTAEALPGIRLDDSKVDGVLRSDAGRVVGTWGRFEVTVER